MKLGISNLSFDIAESNKVYSLMKKYNFTGLELAPTKIFGNNPYSIDNELLLNFKTSIKKENFEIISMQSLLYGQNNLEVFNLKTQQKLLDYLFASMDFAKKLNCPVLVFGSPKNRIYTRDSYIEDALSFFTTIGDYALANNTKFCIEVNPKEYNTNFITSFNELLHFNKLINHPGLGLHIDLGSMILNKESFTTLERYVDNINHIHISLPYLNYITNTNISNFTKLNYILREYKNYISIEMKEATSLNIIENSLSLVSNLFN